MFTDRMMTHTHTHEVLFLIVAGLHTHTAVTEVYQKIMLNLDDVVFRQSIKASKLSHTSKLLLLKIVLTSTFGFLSCCSHFCDAAFEN